MMSSSRQFSWQKHPPRMDRKERHWLTDTDSLTLKLKRRCRQFQVIRADQGKAGLHFSEKDAMQLPLHSQVMARNVILCCDGQPVVLGHTITAWNTLRRHWPFFHGLGQNALGLVLFFNPLIIRKPLEYKRLGPHHMLYKLAQKTLLEQGFGLPLPPYLWARRGVFVHQRHKNSRMLVTEIMLPPIYQLAQPQGREGAP